MRPDFADEIVEQFERGGLSRRQLASRLMGLGAALAVLPGTARGGQDKEAPSGRPGWITSPWMSPTCPGPVTSTSSTWGWRSSGTSGEDNCFLGSGGGFFLTLFRGDKPGLNHYCYAIKDFDADRAEEKLKAAGLKVRRESGRIYFDDPDGIEVQVAGS